MPLWSAYSLHEVLALLGVVGVLVHRAHDPQLEPGFATLGDVKGVDERLDVLEHELAVFDMTIGNRHRKVGVGLADDAHRITVGQIDLSMNDKTLLLGLHGMEAQKKGQ